MEAFTIFYIGKILWHTNNQECYKIALCRGTRQSSAFGKLNVPVIIIDFHAKKEKLIPQHHYIKCQRYRSKRKTFC